MSWTPTFAPHALALLALPSFAESHSFTRSCVLSSKVSPLATHALALLAHSLTFERLLTLSLSLIHPFVCALVEAYTPHSFDSFVRSERQRRVSHIPTRPQQLQQPPAVEHDSNGVARYEVESVLAQRGGASRRELLVRWKGYGAEDDQWLPRAELTRSAPTAVAPFDALQADGSIRIAQLALRARSKRTI